MCNVASPGPASRPVAIRFMRLPSVGSVGRGSRACVPPLCGGRPVGRRYRAGLFETIRTAPPIGDLGLVYVVARVVDRRKTRRGTRPRNRCRPRARRSDKSGGGDCHRRDLRSAPAIQRAGCAGSASRNQKGQGVVHRLQRDGTDLGPDDLGHGVGRNVGLTGDRPQDRQPLGRHLNAPLTKKRRRIGPHPDASLNQSE